jgi:hypothetical protein
MCWSSVAVAVVDRARVLVSMVVAAEPVDTSNRTRSILRLEVTQ